MIATDRARRRAFAAAAVVLGALVILLSITGQPEAPPPSSSTTPDAGREPIVSAPPSDGAPAADAPADDAPAEDAPAEDALADDAPAEGSPSTGETSEPGSRRRPPVRLEVRISPADRPVYAVAERFLRAYLVYELGDPPAAVRRTVAGSSTGALRRLLAEPPRVPPADRPVRGHLVSLDRIRSLPAGAGGPRRELTFGVRRAEYFEQRVVVVAYEQGTWRVSRVRA